MASPSGGGAKVKGSPRKGPAYTNAFKKWKSRSGNEESGALASCSPEPIPSCALCLYCFLQDDCPPSITIYTIYILALANGKCAIISITVINVYVSLSRFFFRSVVSSRLLFFSSFGLQIYVSSIRTACNVLNKSSFVPSPNEAC